MCMQDSYSQTVSAKKCALRIGQDYHCMTTTALKVYLGHPHYYMYILVKDIQCTFNL